MVQKYKFSIPGPDAGAKVKFDQFRTGASANLVTLGYDVGDLDEIIAAATEFGTALADSDSAKVAAKNAIADKDAARRSSTQTIMKWVERVKTNPLATTEILNAFGIEASTETNPQVYEPTELNAKAAPSGNCTLSWSANGNIYGTTYILESSPDGEFWTWLGSTSQRRFVDASATPGVPKFYRVRAQRIGITTAPSSWTNIYPAGGGDTLQVAA